MLLGGDGDAMAKSVGVVWVVRLEMVDDVKMVAAVEMADMVAAVGMVVAVEV